MASRHYSSFMTKTTRSQLLLLVNIAMGICCMVGIFTSLRGTWGMIQVWIGEVTVIPVFGEISYSTGTSMDLLFALLTVGFSGLAYGAMWVTPASSAFLMLMWVASHLKRS